MSTPLLQVNNVVKQFPGVTALDNVSLELNSGEVLCLVGENGAGKSTLIKILAGVFSLTSGEVLLNGKKVNVKKPHDALELGFSVVYQEHRLLKNLTVAENIYFGRFPMKNGLVDFKKLNKDTQIVLDKLGMGIKANKLVSELNASQSQMVEIAKALSIGSKIMILDEPSAAITDSELENLFEIIKMLKKEGKSFIYISHRLKEIFEIGDRVVVLKDGKNAGQDDVKNLNIDKIVSMMVGRDIGKVFKPKDRKVGDEVLRVVGLTNDVVNNCSFNIKAGEIVGFAGLVGSGRSELAESVFGYRKKSSGDIYINSVKTKIRNPKQAIQNKMGFVTEDRKSTGVILSKRVGMNTSFAILNRLTRLGFIKNKEETKLINEYMKTLKVKTPSIKQEAQFLSGGNQQKVILAKWLLTESQLLICDEPTKGIDVGTKQEFYYILDDLARQGIAIMLISSELPEIIGLSNRVYVMQDGRIVKELQQDQLDEKTIANYAMKEVEE